MGNLSYQTKWQDLKDHMKQMGDVVRADVATSREDGRSRGYGIVVYSSAREADGAIQQVRRALPEPCTLHHRMVSHHR